MKMRYMNVLCVVSAVLVSGAARGEDECSADRNQMQSLQKYRDEHPKIIFDAAFMNRYHEVEKRLWDCSRQQEHAEMKQREEEKKRAEEERYQAEKEAAEQAAREDEENTDALLKKHTAVIFGASLCVDRLIRSTALADIAREKKYGRIGGVVDKRKLYDLQERVRWADEQEASDRKDLATYRKVKPAPCSHPLVKQVMSCRMEGDDCDELSRDLSRFVTMPDGE